MRAPRTEQRVGPSLDRWTLHTHRVHRPRTRVSYSGFGAGAGLYCTEEDLDFALEDFLASSHREGLHESRSLHWKPTGWYSSEVALSDLKRDFYFFPSVRLWFTA